MNKLKEQLLLAQFSQQFSYQELRALCRHWYYLEPLSAELEAKWQHVQKNYRDSTWRVMPEASFFTLFDDVYPLNWLQSYQPPLVVYYQGNLNLLRSPSLAIVGSRNCSPYAARTLKLLIQPLAKAVPELVIISGLARGVDGLAHQAALHYHLPTIAILGNGVGYHYPPEHADLQTEIAQKGLLLSEYPLFQAPKRWYFPQRNRLIASLADGVLVVEAHQRSGALLTADLALDENRTVMAVPGSIDSPESAGTNWLVKQGATPITNFHDIMLALTLST